MNKVFVRLYAFFCSIVLLGTFGMFIFKLVKSSKEDLIKAEKNFKYIANFIATNSETEDISSVSFSKRLQELCALSGNIDKVLLLDFSDKTVFSWEAKTNTASTKTIKIESNSFVLKPYSMNISIKSPSYAGSRLVNFSALLKSISDDVIYNGIRDSLFIFAVLFLLTLMILIVNYLANDKGRNAKAIQFNIDDIEEKTKLTIEVKKEALDKAPEYSLEDLKNVSFSSNSSNKSLEFSDINTQKIDKTLQAENADKTINQRSIKENSNQKLACKKYSSISGLSCEEYFEEKLDFELGRASSSEQDLSLILFKLNDIDKNMLKELATILLKRFKFRDMLFDFGESGFAVILHDADLEKSMQEAENAYIDILQIISKEKIAIGITTRSSRLVSAKRLIDEASSALARSFNNSNSPIVAFRPDPAAYRDYIKEYT